MMMDREARNKAVMLLRQLATGKITHEQFDSRFPWESKDGAIEEIGLTAWECFEEIGTRHLIGKWALTKQDRRVIARWILYLESELEYIIVPESDEERNARLRASRVEFAMDTAKLLISGFAVFASPMLLIASILFGGWPLFCILIVLAAIPVRSLYRENREAEAAASKAAEEQVINGFYPFETREDFVSALKMRILGPREPQGGPA